MTATPTQLIAQWRTGDQTRFGRSTLEAIICRAQILANETTARAAEHPIGPPTHDRVRAERRALFGIVNACRIELDRLNRRAALYDVAAVVPGCGCPFCAAATAQADAEAERVTA